MNFCQVPGHCKVNFRPAWSSSTRVYLTLLDKLVSRYDTNYWNKDHFFLHLLALEFLYVNCYRVQMLAANFPYHQLYYKARLKRRLWWIKQREKNGTNSRTDYAGGRPYFLLILYFFKQHDPVPV